MSNITRRQFIKTSAAFAGVTIIPTGFAYGQAGPETTAANGKLNIACIGVGGRGGAHVGPAAAENLVALCDTNLGTANGARRSVQGIYLEKSPDKPLPEVFQDYRVMLDKLHDKIDAVVVATPDHHHAVATMAAIKLGKHVYCEKPLTHDIYQARQVAIAAREHKVATQMGNQGRAEEGWRRLCENVWAGAIGDVKEVHVWTDRPGIPARFWWPQGGTRPAGMDPIPDSLNWDVWLGAAPQRPYLGQYKDGRFKGQNVYTPFVWRGWWDFGTGALGDIGCHSISGTFSALKIEHATAVELIKDSGDGNEDMFPRQSIIKWYIPARGDMPPCNLYWYDGAAYPPPEVINLKEGQQFPDNGTILIGTKGKMDSGGGFIAGSENKEFTAPPKTIPRCESDHFREWVTAAKGGRPAFSNFDHAGPLTEFVLLGNLALKAGPGKKVEWDGPNLRVTNMPELNQWVKREYRQGWSL